MMYKAAIKLEIIKVTLHQQIKPPIRMELKALIQVVGTMSWSLSWITIFKNNKKLSKKELAKMRIESLIIEDLTHH